MDCDPHCTVGGAIEDLPKCDRAKAFSTLGPRLQAAPATSENFKLPMGCRTLDREFCCRRLSLHLPSIQACFKTVSSYATDSGLCRGWMKRIQELEDSGGDRLHH